MALVSYSTGIFDDEPTDQNGPATAPVRARKAYVRRERPPPHDPNEPCPMPPPPEAVFDSLHELKSHVQAWTHQHGYDVVITSTPKGKSKQVRCGRSGKPQNKWNLTEETRQRKRSSQKIGCTMGLYYVPHKDGRWSIRHCEGSRSFRHNHDPVPKDQTTANHRRAHRTEEIRSIIISHIEAGIPSRQSIELLEKTFPHSFQTRKDVHNIRQKYKREVRSNPDAFPRSQAAQTWDGNAPGPGPVPEVSMPFVPPAAAPPAVQPPPSPFIVTFPLDGTGRETPTHTAIIRALHLQPHVDGGYFVETDRDSLRVPTPWHAPTHPHSHAMGWAPYDTRSAMSSMQFYLTPKAPVAYFHRDRARTIHTLHKGRGRFVILHADEATVPPPPGGPGAPHHHHHHHHPHHGWLGTARVETFDVGPDVAAGERSQWVVGGGKYTACFLLPDKAGKAASKEGLLVSETVVPGFEYCDHDLLADDRLAALVTPAQRLELAWLVRGGHDGPAADAMVW